MLFDSIMIDFGVLLVWLCVMLLMSLVSLWKVRWNDV